METKQGILEAADRTIWAARRKVIGPAGVSEHATIPHLEFMFLQMRKQQDLGKLNRWLGYIQGVAVGLYGVPLDTVREINGECLYE